MHSMATVIHCFCLQTKTCCHTRLTMCCGGNIDVCVHKQDQMALYFKIQDGKYEVGDSGYCRESGKSFA